jgi:phosphohistidine phosphatase
MKKLIFVRHGKAEDPSSGISDFERSLTLKGKIISRMMGKKLRGIEKSPVKIISSPAFRAMETALIFALEFGIDPDKILINSNIYYKMNLRSLPEVISAAGDNCETIILFGHNPSFTELVSGLCREGCDFMAKTSIAAISFDILTWPEIRQKAGKLEYFLKPDKES